MGGCDPSSFLQDPYTLRQFVGVLCHDFCPDIHLATYIYCYDIRSQTKDAHCILFRRMSTLIVIYTLYEQRHKVCGTKAAWNLKHIMLLYSHAHTYTLSHTHIPTNTTHFPVMSFSPVQNMSHKFDVIFLRPRN